MILETALILNFDFENQMRMEFKQSIESLSSYNRFAEVEQKPDTDPEIIELFQKLLKEVEQP